MNVNQIKVNDYQILSSMNTTDLSTLSEADLKKELKRRERQKSEDRKAYKELVKQTVPDAILKLINISEQLSNAKTEIFKLFEDALQMKQSIYGVKEHQQSHTFSSEMGDITIGYRVNDGWDDTVNTGIAKVEKYISSLSKSEETAALVDMVFRLLRKDTKGNLKSNRVLELQKLTEQITDEEFRDGVDIISKAHKPVRSVWFIDAALHKDNGEKTNIPLNISSVDFAGDYEFNFENEADVNRN